MVSKLRKRRQERKYDCKEKQKEANSREDSGSKASKVETTLKQRDNTEKHKISWEKRKQKVNIAPCKHAPQLTDLLLGAVFHRLMMVVVLVRCAGFHGISYKP